MAKLIFNDDLADKINSKYHIRNSKYPFSSWLVKPIIFKNKHYYLYIEQSTNFAIVGQFLDKEKFKEALYHTLLTLPFITSLQIDEIATILRDLSYSNEKNVTNSSVEKYQKILNSIPNDQVKEIQNTDQIIESILLSAYLNQTAEADEIPISTIFALKANQELPLSSRKPKANTKYVNLKADYTDPRKWEKFENLAPLSIPAKELQKNNLKIIEQFKNSIYFKQSYKTFDVEDTLEVFLNTYLFKQGVRPLTKNLADPINFIELNILLDDQMTPIVVLALHDIFLSFYEFLSHTGTIRKADTEEVKKLLTENVTNITGEESFTNLHQVYNTLADVNLESTKQEGPKGKAQTLPVLSQNENKTYEIRVKLRDFKPTTWRRFIISSSTSLATLQQAVILMFNGLLFGHMYTLQDKKTQKFYDLPEFKNETFDSIDATKVKLSEFGLNQKFTITYDFGDNWEFEAIIKKISDEKPPKHPTILSGKKYGIIEDIGGVERLSDYYNGKVSQEEKEWVGNIDLDEFDIDDMNEQLTQFK